MVNQNQGVTVLDFGLAAMLSEQVQADVSTITNQPLTHPGHAAGTIGYMAPEQIRGEPVGPASDLFALGATLYEAATGRNPFRRAGNLQTIAAVLDDYPLPIRSTVSGFPAHLDAIILKCLEKRPEARYPDGNALSKALRDSAIVQPAPRASARHRSLAVLPFTSPQGDQDDEYLSEGLTTEIITKLARLKKLLVISRSTTHARGSELDSLQIGRELDVQAVLEGRISKRAQRLRVTVQLLEVATGCLRLGRQLRLRRGRPVPHPGRGLEPRRSCAADEVSGRADGAAADASPEAHRLYLQGKALFYRFNRTDNLLAIEAFRRALQIEPRYAAASAGLASACMARLEREWEPTKAGG